MLKNSVPLINSFALVQSGHLYKECEGISLESRNYFLKKTACGQLMTEPPVISCSPFIPKPIIEHLLRNKKDSALAVKYVSGDRITNMEGALHTLVTPLGIIRLSGDHYFDNGHQAESYGRDAIRRVILSAAIHLDFEYRNVIYALVQLGNSCIYGKELDASEKSQNEDVKEWDHKIAAHLIYHLTQGHRLPGSNQKDLVSKNIEKSVEFMEELLQDQNLQDIDLTNHTLQVDADLLSMEMLLNLVLQSLINELSVLEKLCPQGYVYTVSPPRIFSRALGPLGTKFVSRLWCLALSIIAKSNKLVNLQIIGFDNFDDKEILKLVQIALVKQNRDIKVMAKNDLFSGGNGHLYSGPEQCALVIHNNSDAFGQNIETEGMSSLDGVIGSCSDAACLLNRQRDDLMTHIC